MRRLSTLLIVSTLLAMQLRAQEPAPTEAAPPPPPPPSEAALVEEIRALRAAVEAQGRILVAVSERVAVLQEKLTGSAAAPAPSSATAAPATPAPAGDSAPPPAPAAAATSAPAEAANTGNKHTIARGETLTSIAKHYKIPLSELTKANSIQDERKLQVGQVLNIPTPAGAPAPETSLKKETP